MLYKLTLEDGRPGNGGSGQWCLPHGKRPGKWMPAMRVNPCVSGYHLCRVEHIMTWALPVLWEAEGRGECVEVEDKLVFAEARLLRRVDTWNERTVRELACDLAERSLGAFEKYVPNDSRPRDCIEVARRFARGEVNEAASSAASSAARSAAWRAAMSAADSAAWSAASSAASRAARRAASSAASSAAWSAEKQWQTERLIEVLGL